MLAGGTTHVAGRQAEAVHHNRSVRRLHGIGVQLDAHAEATAVLLDRLAQVLEVLAGLHRHHGGLIHGLIANGLETLLDGGVDAGRAGGQVELPLGLGARPLPLGVEGPGVPPHARLAADLEGGYHGHSGLLLLRGQGQKPVERHKLLVQKVVLAEGAVADGDARMAPALGAADGGGGLEAEVLGDDADFVSAQRQLRGSCQACVAGTEHSRGRLGLLSLRGGLNRRHHGGWRRVPCKRATCFGCE
mmetsp:Transcript_116917/g.363954  ORF Transcript_116917/g.363954 Transcript_116917/m.363954 type:complete len:246 (+) Transcript_116917:584-1321(+)